VLMPFLFLEGSVRGAFSVKLIRFSFRVSGAYQFWAFSSVCR
jgi:hypothetical protein